LFGKPHKVLGENENKLFDTVICRDLDHTSVSTVCFLRHSFIRVTVIKLMIDAVAPQDAALQGLATGASE